MRSWILSTLAVALVFTGRAGLGQLPADSRILLVNQSPGDKTAEGEPVDLLYYVARSIEDRGRLVPVVYKPTDPAVQDAIRAGKVTAADAAATDSNASMRRVAMALGIQAVLFVSARQTRGGLVASGQEEIMSGPEAWRTRFSRTLAPYRSRGKRGSVLEGMMAQAAALARAVDEAPTDASESAPQTPPAAPAANRPADASRAAQNRRGAASSNRGAPANRRTAAGPQPGASQTATPPANPVQTTPTAPPAPAAAAVAQRDPNAPTPDENLADRYRKLGDATNRIFYLRRAINSKPRDARLRTDLIRAYRELGMADAAKSEAIRASLVSPTDPAIHRMLGECLVDTGDVDAALKEFQEAIRLDPKDPAGQMAYGDALWNAGRPDEAEKAYAAAAAADPTKPVPLRRLARVYAQRGRYADCANAMKAAIQLSGEPDALDLAADYAAILTVVENGLNEVVSKLQRARKEALDAARPREEIYRDVAAVKKQAEDYSDFLAALPSPQGYAGVQKLYLQAAALGVQAAEGALVFLESRSESDEKDATILRLETSRQITEASKRLKALTSRGGGAAP